MYRASGNGSTGQHGFGAAGSLAAALASSSRGRAPASGHGVADGVLQRRVADRSLADLFQTMRAIHNVSQSEMARRVGTDVGVVLDFEAGLIDALPPWPVTAAIVERYAALAGLDPSPILSHLLRQQSPLQASAMVTSQRSRPSAAPAQIEQQRHLALPAYGAHRAPLRGEAAHPSRGETFTDVRNDNGVGSWHEASADPRSEAGRPVGFEARTKQRGTTGREPTVRDATSRGGPVGEAAAEPVATQPNVGKVRTDAQVRRRRRVRRTVASAVPIGLIAAVFALVQLAPKPLYAAARMMPAPLEAPMRQLVDLVVYQTAPVRDGLRWIDAGDPRVRKGDRLKVK